MDKKLRKSLSIALAMAMALALGACGAKRQDGAGGTQVEVSDTKVAADVETSVYEGTLLTAHDQHVVIAGEEGDVEFVTNDSTLYRAGEEGQMYLDDIVSVTYHVKDEVKYADEIELVEHMEEALEYAGVLVDSGDDHITLVNKGLSVTFMIDEDSYIVGDLSRGDEIELTYLGNLSEYPYANVVAVVKEVELPTTSTVSGLVSEISGNSVLVGIDSAHAYRFNITNKTTISGAATSLTVGDQVEVTFEGKISDQPNAISVKVVKSNQTRAYVINGTISSVDNGSITLDTGKAKYVFSIGKNTKLNGEKPAKGYKAEITYTGDLNNKPQASIVYCVKDAKDTKDAKKAAAKKAEEAKKKQEEAKKAEEEAKAKAEAEAKARAEEEAKAKAEAEAKAKAEEEAKKAEEEAKAKAEAEAKARAEEEAKKQEEAEQKADDTDSQTEPEPGTDTETDTDNVEPTTDDTGTETGPEEGTNPDQTEDTDQATDTEDTTEEEAGQTNPDMGIIGQGTIIGGDEKEKTIEIELKDGTKITLKFDDDTKIAAGYIPQKDDVVKIEYGNTSMILKDIQLVSRPETPEAEQADAEQETENAD